MTLLVQPDDGFAPILAAIKRARHTIDTTIFRFDMPEVERAFGDAVTRGVQVRALVAHTNRGGEKLLRKLELRLLDAGVTLARSDDDLVRYHGKVLIIDRATLHLMLFNYTRLDTTKSRSFSLSTGNRRIVAEAERLFEADMTRQPFTPTIDELVVSPENARRVLSTFVREATRSLLIYDPKVADRAMFRLLREQQKKGLDVRILGEVGRGTAELTSKRLPELRLHARVIIRDGRDAFLGSQSLRKAELDDRREVGLLVRDRGLVERLTGVFEHDWALTEPESGALGRRRRAATEAAGVDDAARP